MLRICERGRALASDPVRQIAPLQPSAPPASSLVGEVSSQSRISVEGRRVAAEAQRVRAEIAAGHAEIRQPRRSPRLAARFY